MADQSRRRQWERLRDGPSDDLVAQIIQNKRQRQREQNELNQENAPDEDLDSDNDQEQIDPNRNPDISLDSTLPSGTPFDKHAVVVFSDNNIEIVVHRIGFRRQR